MNDESSTLDPSEFCQAGTRRISTLASSAAAPLVAGAGWDGHIYVWDVATRKRVHDVPTAAESGGVSLALSANGSACFVGTYYSWGAACIDLAERREVWRRSDLKRFYGLTALRHDPALVAWFDRKAGLTLDARSGETRDRHVGLRAFYASPFDRCTLKYGRQFELTSPAAGRHTWASESFALLACGFSPDRCVVSEAAAGVQSLDLASGLVSWTYRPRLGAHVTALDFSVRLGCFVALEYAYTDAARAEGPMVTLLHFDSDGQVVFRKAIREWSEAAFCASGELLLNGLGELHDVQTGEVTHVFGDFPR